MIVCIPSKGRAETKTHLLFEASGFEVFHFLEPQEIDSYDVPNKVNIGCDDMGISFVRNFILQWAEQHSHQFICMCDDDINQFGVTKNNKSIAMPNADALTSVFSVFEKSDFAIGSINQRQFAWSEKKRFKINNGKFNGIQLINIQKISWSFYEGGKEDIDFFMQCLDNRQNHIFFPRHFYNCPPIGTNAGGLHEYYKSGKDEKAAKNLQGRWRGYVKLIEQYGRLDVRCDFKGKAKDMGLKVI